MMINKYYWLAYLVLFAATFTILPPAIEPERLPEYRLEKTNE